MYIFHTSLGLKERMKPVSPASNDDDLSAAESSDLAQSSAALNAAELATLETVQRRYVNQLNEDIKRLETDKAQLEAEVAGLKASYAQLQASIQLAKAGRGPRLPGEPAPALSAPTFDIYGRSVELPVTPVIAQRSDALQAQDAAAKKDAQMRKGVVLSMIATVLMAWHYGLIGALAQGGNWLGLNVGQLEIAFVPAVALLWLRMLVMVPALILLATQIHRRTWEDLQEWIYRRDRLITVLIGSGIALFFSQVLLYQAIAQVGPVLGATLLFLYPLLVVPLGLLTRRWRLSPLGGIALAAIAMGGFLTIRPTVRPAIGTATPTAIWLGLLASVAFSLYLVLTNVSYQQQCHPIPVGVVQFSTVAVLSSIVLIVKPLELENISLFSFALWGILLGTVMLLVYLFDYSSLRMSGARATAVVAITPLATVAIAWSFSSPDPLEIIQWTGILLLSIGGGGAQPRATQQTLSPQNIKKPSNS